MLKKFSKFLLLVLLVFVVSSSSLVCLAHEAEDTTNSVTTTETNEETDTTDEDTTTPEIHSGDLYLFGNNIVMDQLVDGNAFILGNNVKITGQVNGNLYVLANQVNFDGALIRHSIFVCANHMYYNNSGTYEIEGNAYIAANTLETTYTSYVSRDIKILASDVTFKSAVGRDADIICNTLNLGEGKDISAIYGDLRYTSNSQIVIPGGAVQGSVTYSKQYMGNSITGILMGFGTCIVTALAVYIILNKLTPSFIQKVSDDKFSILKLLKSFGIGLATIAIVSIFVILLAGTGIGILLAVILALLFAILCIIAIPTFAIKITNTLKPVLKIEKGYILYLVITLVSIILYGITLIPFVGGILGFVIKVTAIGLIVNVYLPHKDLSKEEKVVLEESKKIAKENKEKTKQEKLEAKANKKQENAKIKNDKKAEKAKAKESKQKAKVDEKETKKKDKKK